MSNTTYSAHQRPSTSGSESCPNRLDKTADGGLEVDYPARSESRMSTFSSDSSCNLVDHDGDRLSKRSHSLPSFWSSTPEKGSRCCDIGGTLRRAGRGWRVIVFGSWLNVLLVLVPVTCGLGIIVPGSHTLVFAFCILALIPLIKLHDLATRELALRIGGSKTGLLNASMSNVVEIVVAFSALRKCELGVVQSSLIGSILSKLLLVLGSCFLAGGIRFSEQDFDTIATQINTSLLSVSVAAVLLPAAYHFALSGATDATSDWQKQNILRMSHGVSIILLLVYIAYLIFQLWSHTHLYQDIAKNSSKHSKKIPIAAPAFVRSMTWMSEKTAIGDDLRRADTRTTETRGDTRVISPSKLTPPRRPYLRTTSASSSEVTLAMLNEGNNSIFKSSQPAPVADSTVRLIRFDGGDSNMRRVESNDSTCSNLSRVPSKTGSAFNETGQREFGQKQEVLEPTTLDAEPARAEEESTPQLSWPLTILVLTAVTVMVSVTADWLVESMDGISTTISKEWIGLILLPAVSSIAECITAANVSVKDQLTLSISVAVGSTIQTALFVIPLMVTLAWAMGKPLALLFDPFQSLVLYMSVQTMSYVVATGKSNWLEGFILIGLYIIIAVSFWFYPTPTSSLSISLAVCSASL